IALQPIVENVKRSPTCWRTPDSYGHSASSNERMRTKWFRALLTLQVCLTKNEKQHLNCEQRFTFLYHP
ncbi:hypothetical protein, partial [Stenomitos frigidus]|uniref:hypothetical protein n=1 Tax=Stenomitos frigidus TaxID=1886765 RepID=UPI001C626947